MTECCAPPPLILRPQTDRFLLIRAAFRLEWLTIGWMTVEAVVAISAGIMAGSLVLVAFGLDSVIELASAGVLMWRLSVELRHGQKFSERAERIASRIGGALAVPLGGLCHRRGRVATVATNWRGILMAGLHRRPDRHSRHALLGATQDRYRRKDRKPRAPRRCDGSRDLRVAVLGGCRQSRRSVACRRDGGSMALAHWRSYTF